MNKLKILELLLKSDQKYLSGQWIATELSITRSAVCRHIKTLKLEGHPIKSKTNAGYFINNKHTIICANIIEELLTAPTFRNKLFVYETVDSTNTIARDLALKEKNTTAVIIANEQTNGRGRMNRVFHSPKKNGIYMSILIRPNTTIDKLALLTIIPALCVAKAIEQIAHIKPNIKWVNDILIQNQKVCGILTECSSFGEDGFVNYAVVGIGINMLCADCIPNDGRNAIGAIGEFTQKTNNHNDLIATILNLFDFYTNLFLQKDGQSKIIAEYQNYLTIIGKQVCVTLPHQTYTAKVLALSENGGLILRHTDGSSHELNYGEVSVKAY